MPHHFNYIIIGGGIIGVSTAWQLQQKHPQASILLLEKETELGRHQTGHNSGVIHAGVYYQPGSLKARLCKEGSAEIIRFCQQYQLPYEQCGKLLVATNELEEERLAGLAKRCQKNEIAFERLDNHALHACEPNIAGNSALLVPSSGITSYLTIALKMATLFRQAGGTIKLGATVTSLREESSCLYVDCGNSRHSCDQLIVCPGLHADHFVHMLGHQPDFRVIPFRGEYFQLRAQHNQIVRHLIYPVPDPSLPFLGVHLTRMIDGTVTVGPNAVLALAREGYRWRDINPTQLLQTLLFAGSRKFFAKHLKTGLHEFRNSLWKPGYLQQVRKYCPKLMLEDLQPYPAGVRAQAMKKDGTLVDDFLFFQSERALIVCNAPSPAATSSIPIGRTIIERMANGTGPTAMPSQ